MQERRRQNRAPVQDGVLYLYESKGLQQDAQYGLAFDVSNDGACIYTQQQFATDDSIKLFCAKFGEEPRSAYVKWCRRIDENLFKVGVSFKRDSK